MRIYRVVSRQCSSRDSQRLSTLRQFVRCDSHRTNLRESLANQRRSRAKPFVLFGVYLIPCKQRSKWILAIYKIPKHVHARSFQRAAHPLSFINDNGNAERRFRNAFRPSFFSRRARRDVSRNTLERERAVT